MRPKFLRGFLVDFYHLSMNLFRLPRWYLRESSVHATSTVGARVFVNNSRIGKYTYIGEGVYAIHSVIGNYCSIAAGVKIGGMDHYWRWLSTSTKLSDKYVYDRLTIVGDDVWIGFNACIRQGVKIGRGAVIGAGTIVTEDVAPYSIVAGVPGKVLKKRFSLSTIAALERSGYWNHKPDIARGILRELEHLLPEELP